MHIAKIGDVTFVQSWQRPYDRCAHTGMVVPLKPTKEYYDTLFPALAKSITTPLAFAILAPFGWPGEACWFETAALADNGWEPVFWRESSHADKSFVQLFMLQLKREDLKERPAPPKKPVGYASYDDLNKNHAGDLPYLGCSSILSAFSEGEDVYIPQPGVFQPKAGKQGSVAMKIEPDMLLHLLRISREVGPVNEATLKKAGFNKLASLAFNEYWVRGKPGIGKREECEY